MKTPRLGLALALGGAWMQPAVGSETAFGFGGVRFEANRGRADSAVRYIGRARGRFDF